MNTFQQIIGQMKHAIRDPQKPSKAQKHLLKEKSGIGKNIYDMGIRDEPAQKHVKRWEAICYKWKYFFFKPGILLAEIFLSKHYRKFKGWKDLRKNPHNENLVVFDRAFDKAVEDWYGHYFWPTCPVRYMKNGKWVMKPSRKDHVTMATSMRNKYGRSNVSTKTLNAIKETTLSYALNDTVYREFINILMHRIYLEMHEQHKNSLVKDADGKLVKQHLFYSSALASDPHYFYLYHQVATGKVQTRCTHHPLPDDIDKMKIHPEPGEMPVMLDKVALNRAMDMALKQIVLEIQAEKQIRSTGVDPYEKRRVSVPEWKKEDQGGKN